MKVSIKIKFSIFLGGLLLLTVFVLSLLVLHGIKTNQQDQYEQYLSQQAKTANVYFLQTLLAESNKVAENYLSRKGEEFASQLELITGQGVVLYDKDGAIVSKKLRRPDSISIHRTLEYALNNKTAYLVEGESLYYLSPIRIGKEQVGVVQFNFSLSQYIEFYNQIKQLFIYISGGVFFLSFLLGFIYFGSFANGIIGLLAMVDGIGDGNYDNKIKVRGDELGRLGRGIHEMSLRIKETMEGMEEEKKKLTLAVAKLSSLDEQQKQFIGNVTHEFKTPLTSMKAYLDLLEMYPEDKDLLETARESIKSENQKLYEMVTKVLQLSALDKYDFEYNMEKIEIKQIIEEVLNRLKGKLDKFAIVLSVDLIEANVYGDKDGILIILMNLLDNAIKYNKAGGSIFVKNYVNENQLIIEIADTGIGIPKELVKEVFEPFYTVDKSRTRENGGVGLGLSLANKYANIQGGSISLVKSSYEGSTFRIMLPIYYSMEK